MSNYFTGSGDDGYTGLLGEGRVPKHHPRPEAVGSVDEASAALGLARAHATADSTKQALIQVQRDLYHLMAEVAAPPENAERFRKLDAQRVNWLEEEINQAAEGLSPPDEFVLAGDSTAGAALHLARTIVRRAERALARLSHDGQLDSPEPLRYLNRLSSLCFVLALKEDQRAGVASPSLAKDP
jgi:cob(I)alamin adenosyltransferase